MINISKEYFLVWFFVNDMDRALAFYKDKLGLNVIERVENYWVKLEGPVKNSFIGLNLLQGKSVNNPGGGTAVFEVDDVKQTVDSLTHRGIEFDHGIQELRGHITIATFHDPDNNRLQIIHHH